MVRERDLEGSECVESRLGLSVKMRSRGSGQKVPETIGMIEKNSCSPGTTHMSLEKPLAWSRRSQFQALLVRKASSQPEWVDLDSMTKKKMKTKSFHQRTM